MTDDINPSVAASTPEAIQAPAVVDQSAQARAGGYSWDEINSHLADKRQQAKDAGYSDEEINKYLGIPQPPAGKQYFSLGDIANNSARAFIDYPKAAYQGLQDDWEDAKEGFNLPTPDGFWNRVHADVDQIGRLGSIPVDVLNTAISPLTSIYGAAVSRPLSYSESNLIQSMMPKGEELSKEEMEKHQRILEQGFNLAPLVLGMKDSVASYRMKTSPTLSPQDTADAATAVTGIKGANAVDSGVGTAAQNLYNNWVKTGEPPIEAAQRAQNDPVFRAQLQAPPPADVHLGFSETKVGEDAFIIDKQDMFTAEAADSILHPEREPNMYADLQKKVDGMDEEAAALRLKMLDKKMEAGIIKPREIAEREILSNDGQPPIPPKPPGGEPPAPPENPTPWEHVASRIADMEDAPGMWQRIKDFGYRTYLEYFDPEHPINALVDSVQDGKALPDLENPKYLYRFADLSNTRSQYMVERNMIDINGNITGKGLNDILDPLKGKEKDFWTYSVAKWAVEKADQAKETGVDVDAARQVATEGEGKFGKPFKELVDWQNGTLKYAKDGGLISEENYAKMVGDNQSRIPGYRVDDEASEKVKGAGPGKTAYSPVKQFFGSDKKIEPILKSLLQESFLRIELANRNRANLALADLAQETGIGEKIASQPRPFELTDDELLKLGKEAFTTGKEDPSAATIFRVIGKNIGKDDVPIFRDGKMEIWNFKDPDLTNVLRGYDNITRTAWQRVAGSLTNVTRNMIVLNPAFPVKLMSYDIPWQFITKPVMRNTIADTYVGLREIMGDGPAYDEWMRRGGAERIFQGLTKNDYIKDILKGHEDPGYLDGVWNAVRTPYDALRSWAQTLNQAQRVGRFARGVEQGESKMTAAAASSDAAFHRAGFGGPAAKSWNSVAPFFTAYINSLNQTFRGMLGIGRTITGDQMNAAAFSAKATAVVTIPLLANWYFNQDKPWYKSAPDWQKDNGILIHVGPDEAGHTIFVKYPPLISLIYGAIPRRMAEQFLADNPHAWDGFGKSFGASFAPPGGLINYNIFLPVAEHLANHSFFRDQPLVPDDTKRNVLAPEQYNPYSSGTAKGLSRFLNDMPLVRNFGLSPPVIDNYITDWGGTIGTAAVRAADMALGTGPRAGNAPAMSVEDMPLLNSFLSRYPSASAQPIRDFETRMDNYNAVHGSLMRALEAGDLKRFKEIVDENPTAAAMHRFQFTQSVAAKIPQGQDMTPYMGILQQAAKQINGDDAGRVLAAEKALKNMKDYVQAVNSNTKITPVEKRQLLDQTYGWMQEISERGVGSMNRTGMP